MYDTSQFFSSLWYFVIAEQMTKQARVCSVLGLEARASCLLDRRATAELEPWLQTVLLFKGAVMFIDGAPIFLK